MAKLKTVVETELKGHCCKKRVLKPGVEAEIAMAGDYQDSLMLTLVDAKTQCRSI